MQYVSYSQKEIYRSGKITGAVRILKGQEILPDDSTLVHHNISDGNTVNIVIEPDRHITINITHNLATYKHEISSALLVKISSRNSWTPNKLYFYLTNLTFKLKYPKMVQTFLKIIHYHYMSMEFGMTANYW